jgi:hypothetical protein
MYPIYILLGNKMASKQKASKKKCIVYLPPRLQKQLEMIADVDGETLNSVIVDALKDAIEGGDGYDMEDYVAQYAELEDEDDDEEDEDEEDEDEEDDEE